ncbi:tetratricopeptide repeat protein [Geomonas subterranea]|uniref:Tetratricopeptide repeat protein n=1 Tax=Geomonas subterranea TaxID=2847989 RepID=A0ABX8LJ52_9BACT|nr:tetratricopeptide repeat protein [Geomonas subterranea]QXE92061.1 tetratricopeptide repeat protein [Geomonas subterranea]QXM09846.1 tetratricopeptide repeat protein [Geomonas subterranea]
MFFGLFGKKDFRHYQNQGAKHLAAERYSDARVDFQEALKLCPAEEHQEAAAIRQAMDQACDKLGELNLQEGEHALRAGEAQKAHDHFCLAADLAADPGIKSRARAEAAKLEQPEAQAEAKPAAPAGAGNYKPHGGGSCTTCKGHGDHHHEEPAPMGMSLSEEDQFFLMVQPLPGDLPGRYADLGPKFAKAYLMIHEGNDREAFTILQEMLLSGENDIVLYEVALIMFRAGQIHESEALLNRALALNPQNATVYLALIHLMAGGGRYPQAIAVAQRMLELNIIPDQAQFMLGELHEATGDTERAMELWTKSLEQPGMAKAAAERLIPILNRQGRTDDVKYLTKKYLKGCC